MIDGASKKNNFQKKLSKNICRGDMLFSRANKCGICPTSRAFPMENPWGLEISNIDFHWVSFGNIPDFKGNSTILCAWKWDIFSTNKYFLINFFKKVILFWRSINPILQNVTKRRGMMRTQKKHSFWEFCHFCSTSSVNLHFTVLTLWRRSQ